MEAISGIAEFVKNQINITRIFDAPRELVWKLWTDPEMVRQWWGPATYSAPASKIDLRVGGAYLNCMRSPEGIDYWSTGTYLEIVPFERIVCTDSFADEKGNIVPASFYGFEVEFPLELLITVTFEDYGSRQTRLTLQHVGHPGGKLGEMATAGWNESFDKLAQALDRNRPEQVKTKLSADPSQPVVVVTREFDAPRELLFKTYTDPALIPRWWGPTWLTTEVERMEPREGGRWRFINRDAEGGEHNFHGVYHEVTAPSRLVYTFEYEGAPGHVMLEIVTFEDRNGRTWLTDTAVFQSFSDRDGMVLEGMQEGAIDTMERFAALLQAV